MIRTLLVWLVLANGLTACDNAASDSEPDEPRRTESTLTASRNATKTSADPIHEAQRCTKNEDCVASREMYVDKGNNSCCCSCNTQPLAKSWLAGAAKDCDDMGSVGCPVKKCAPLEPVACVNGKCTVATPK